jgi:DNA-directed RNA polymerase subunit RPC12/RpoP
VIGQDDIARIQDELGKLAIDAARIDLDGFLEAVDLTASPQALAEGISPRFVVSAGKWAEMAQLLKPFRDHAVEQLAQIRTELAESDEDLVPRDGACPGCGERRVDELSINADDSVVCATCGRRYSLADRDDEGQD